MSFESVKATQVARALAARARVTDGLDGLKELNTERGDVIKRRRRPIVGPARSG